tara:strand:+ start:16240 stop:18306 length:2067 start_codon:yes stop_codon:yes gene_type:complete
MLLKSLKLNNIRSYLDEKIEFPEGSCVLAGDIGSGKSTILLSIEFALFGLKKGEITGSTLLRHGSNQGSIELSLNLQGKDITIKRTLKRTNKDIKQDSGYIISNDQKQIGTSEELKATILDLLGYPKEFLKKKELVYRYTVYTPQEEMKKIVYENKELRLDTLRKVFNIDKYKRIIENSKILTTSLREKKKTIEGFTLDLDQKKKDCIEKQNSLLDLDKKIKETLPKLTEIQKQSSEIKNKIKLYEDQIQILNTHKKNLSVLEANFNNKLQLTKQNNSNLEKIESLITTLESELKDKQITDTSIMKEMMEKNQSTLSQLELNYRENLKLLQETKATIQLSKSTIQKIQKIDSCPMCEQQVSHTHKDSINSREQKKIDELNTKIAEFTKQEKDFESKINTIKTALETQRKSLSELEILKHKFNSLTERKKEKEIIQKDQEQIKKEIGTINLEKQNLFQEIEKLKSIEQEYSTIKLESDKIFQQEKSIEIEKATLEQEKKSSLEFIESLNKEIKEKEKSLSQLKKITSLQNWTQDFFVKLMGTIEKHVFTQIHRDFSEFFKEWFNILIEDENLNVRLDDDFTPIIEQNGYDTALDNLSGGEKTAVALAYRLSLNKVINDVISEIKTKDIIMLDEPTDGFSTEQLDKVREVLDLLDVKQIIMVSHEAKIESFVQNVIRVEKQGHISSVSML